MLIGDRVRINSTIAMVELAADTGGTLQIGDGTFINYGCSIAATQLVQIGPNCNIGTHVIMMDNDFHRLEPERRTERPPSAPILERECLAGGARDCAAWGDRLAQAAQSAQTVWSRDIPPRSVAAGVPAKVIRSL